MENFRKLVERLLERTSARAIAWEQTAENDEYQVSFSNNSVRIRSGFNNSGSMLYSVDLVNDSGQIVETFDDEMIDRSNVEGVGIYFRKMGELFGMARRNALGADKVLEDIMLELDQAPQSVIRN